MRVLERDRSLAVLDERMAVARRGRGSAVFVAGEAGIGKTTLVRTFLQGLDRSTVRLVGACDPLSTPRPFGPLVDISADRASGFADAVDVSAEPIDVLDQVLRFLRRGLPTTFVIEDVHWADGPTIDLVRFVGRRVADSRCLFVCTYRDDEVGPDHPLRPVLGDLAPSREWVHRIQVEPLSLDAVAELAAGHADPRRVHEITGGNAFFVTELLAAGGVLPSTVSDAVLARVGRLDPDARRVVDATSIAPSPLEVARAVVLAGADVDAAERARDAGVLVGTGESLAFRHELARTAVESSMLPARCIDLHRRMLALLEQDAHPDLARLAHHAIRSGSDELVQRYAPAAADEAAARGAHRQAAELLTAAVDHGARIAPDELAELRLRLAGELAIVNRPDDAAEVVGAAVEHHRRSGDRPALARALSVQARVRWNVDPDGARALIEEAIALLEREPPGRPLAHAYYLAGHFYMLARRRERALHFSRRSIDLAEALGFEHEVASGRLALGTTELVVGDAEAGIEMLEGLVARDAEQAKQHTAVVALGMLGSGGGEVRRYEQAEWWLRRSVELCRLVDEDYGAAYSTAWLARIAFERGEWDRAAALASTAGQEGYTIIRLTAGGALGRVRVRRGDPGGREVLAELAEPAGRLELQHRWPITAGLAEHAWLRGDAELVQRVVEADYELALSTDSAWARGELGFWMWQCGAIAAPPPDAAEPFALHMARRWDDAAQAWRELGCPYEEALALAGRGDEDSLRAALRILHRLGARPAADRVRAALRALGVDDVPPRPRERTRSAPAMLTSRQLEVLDLLCQGSTNAEIAARLYISTKTAGHHVSAVLQKLGARSRTEAVAIATKRGIAASPA